MSEMDRVKYLEIELLSLAQAIANGTVGKIHVIKAYRSATGMTLKDAKDTVEMIYAKAELARQDNPQSDGFASIEVRIATRLASIEARLATGEREAVRREPNLGDILAQAMGRTP